MDRASIADHSDSLRRGVEALLNAFHYARDAEVEAVHFAVEIHRLHELGMIESDFRWLLAKDYLKHFVDTTLEGDTERSLRESGHGRFCSNSCFALTEAGFAFCSQITNSDGELSLGERQGLGLAQSDSEVPHWDPDRQELRFGNHLVKKFKLPSSNQVAVLAAFEEEGWPARILDPLSPRADQDPKRRLHDTIKGLNRSQKTELIRFAGDGTGEGVLWSLQVENLPAREPPARATEDAYSSASETPRIRASSG